MLINQSLISGHKLYFLRHISDDRFGSGFKDELLFDEGGDSVRCWFLLVGFHGFLCILRKSRVFHQNSKGLLQFDLFSIEDVMSNYKDWYSLEEDKSRIYHRKIGIYVVLSFCLLPNLGF